MNNSLIFDDMIEKLELFERKMNILENLIIDLRLNSENKNIYKSEFVLKITKKKKKRKKKRKNMSLF